MSAIDGAFASRGFYNYHISRMAEPCKGLADQVPYDVCRNGADRYVGSDYLTLDSVTNSFEWDGTVESACLELVCEVFQGGLGQVPRSHWLRSSRLVHSATYAPAKAACNWDRNIRC